MNVMSPAATAASTQSTTTSGNAPAKTLSTATDPLTQESTFLKLLVAQIQNQDPMNPSDSMQYMGQLVQYSQLEQLLGINQGVQSLANNQTATAPTPTPAAPAPGTAPSSGGGSQ